MSKKIKTSDRAAALWFLASLILSWSFFGFTTGIFVMGFWMGFFFGKGVAEGLANQAKQNDLNEENDDGDKAAANKFKLKGDGLDVLREKLSQAIQAGEIVELIYWGGTTPGEKREIVPIRFNGSFIVLAKCMNSNSVKSFKLENMEVEGIEEAA